MPKLVHLSYDSPWNPWMAGGGALRDWEIARRFTPPWEVEMWSGAFPGCDGNVREAPATRWFGTRMGNRWASRLGWSASASPALSRLERHDTVVSASPSVFAPVPALLSHRESTVLVVHHLVGFRNAWRKFGPLAFLVAHHERQILSKGRNYVTVNNAVAARIRAANPGARVEFIPNGIDEDLLAVAPARSERPTVAFLGRLDLEMKGIDRLLPAFAKVLETVPDARLVLAGRGSPETAADIRARLQALPSGSVELQTNVTGERKAELLAQAWIFCSPSRFEGWCIAGVEAQAVGLPVVATTADGFLDSVQDGRTGILVDNREASVVQDTAQALISLLRDHARREAMSLAARAWAGQFLWHELARRQQDLCASLLHP
jgi:glycosyltransferase involved in cell wall biosynthesis